MTSLQTMKIYIVYDEVTGANLLAFQSIDDAHKWIDEQEIEGKFTDLCIEELNCIL